MDLLQAVLVVDSKGKSEELTALIDQVRQYQASVDDDDQTCTSVPASQIMYPDTDWVAGVGMDLGVQWEGGSSVMGKAVEQAAKSTEVSLPEAYSDVSTRCLE